MVKKSLQFELGKLVQISKASSDLKQFIGLILVAFISILQLRTDME
jgi:hypothetical protein